MNLTTVANLKGHRADPDFADVVYVGRALRRGGWDLAASPLLAGLRGLVGRFFRRLALIAAVALVVPAFAAARAAQAPPRGEGCSIDYCPSAGEFFECCTWMGPDCACQTCPDFC